MQQYNTGSLCTVVSRPCSQVRTELADTTNIQHGSLVEQVPRMIGHVRDHSTLRLRRLRQTNVSFRIRRAGRIQECNPQI